MAFATAVDEYDVVTPILSKAALLSDTPSVNGISLHDDLKVNDEEHAEDTVTDADETPKPINAEEYAGGEIDENVIAETTFSSVKDKTTIEINGTRICYVPENTPDMHETAHSVLENLEYAEDQDLSREIINHASSQFRGKPIMVYVGSGAQAYAVHPYFLTKSDIGSMPLAEAEDGSYFINLADEDPCQFERLLQYLYQGTCDSGADCPCWAHSAGAEGCTCWYNKDYMQLYALACKYKVYGLHAIITPMLDLKENVLAFCEAFKGAYEKCPGNTYIRELFRLSLLTVFENNLRKPGKAPQCDGWGYVVNNNSFANQLAELASCGGEFAVDLLKAFATARENAILATENDLFQIPGPCKGCGNTNGEAAKEWAGRLQVDETPNQGADCCGDADRLGNGEIKWHLSSPAPVSDTSIIWEDVKDIQGRVHGLEDMVANLQLSAAKSAKTQQAGFSNAFSGKAQPCISQGCGPSVSLQPSRFQPGFAQVVMDETKDPQYQAWREKQDMRDKLVFHPLYHPSTQSGNSVEPASLGW